MCSSDLCGDALVYGNAQVCGGKWERCPISIVSSRHTVTNCSPGKIRIGCRVHTFGYWKKHYKKIGEKNNYTPGEIKEYKEIIDFIAKNGR